MSFLNKIFPTSGPKEKTVPTNSQKTSPRPPLAPPTLPTERLYELFSIAEEREVLPRLPSLSGERVLYLNPSSEAFNNHFVEKGASMVLNVGSQIRSAANLKKVTPLKADIHRLPFQKESIDFVLASLSRHPPFQWTPILTEINRLLKKGGKAIITDWHPFSPFGKKVRTATTNPAVGPDEEPYGFERYFKLFRDQALLIGNVKEVFIDGGFRSFFKTEGEQKFYQQVHSQPLAIFFFLSKGTTRKEKDGDRSTASGLTNTAS
ncbi:MAG: methyltransferase domain-containing protein [Deltaproteobacteria bacterium]|nr:methyltransferase domain-containing protein [Deltaproteobacteria bacterium]